MTINEPQYTVPKCFMDNLRLMLIRMAQTDDRPPSERKAAIERPRQFLEGFLGIDRAELAVENPATVDDVLIACGILNRRDLDRAENNIS